jgi:DNA-binding NarL/FixJ family response regulator
MTIRVVIADDHALFREGLRAILEKQGGFEVVGEASSGLEAVEMAAVLRPDVVIMDLSMPELNGVEATKQIRAHDMRVRILALSAYQDHRTLSEAMRAGASGYVMKRDAFRELRGAILAAYKRRGPVLPEEPLCEPGVAADSMYRPLGQRERQVLQLLAEGMTGPEIASRLRIAKSTVETHRRNIMRKLGVKNLVELTRYAIREGMTSVHAERRPSKQG